MAENSKIEWTHHTFNPWIGCQKVGPGCDHCYAEAMMDARLGRVEWGPHGARQRTSPANWRQPLKWDRDAAAVGERRRVFCASLADVMDSHHSILPEWRADLWALIRATPNLDWLLLTKRPGNIAKTLPPDWGRGYPNVWLGCTVVNQAEADRDVPKLLAVPARVRFLSMEPLLGSVDLTQIEDIHEGGILSINSLTGDCWDTENGDIVGIFSPDNSARIHLVIVGGESGPGARPMHPEWARSLRDQCQAAGVAFFFKQWGEWGHALHMPGVEGVSAATAKTGHWAHPHRYRIHGGPEDGQCFESLADDHLMMRVGKARAGRLLDGRTWDQMPGVAG